MSSSVACETYLTHTTFFFFAHKKKSIIDSIYFTATLLVHPSPVSARSEIPCANSGNDLRPHLLAKLVIFRASHLLPSFFVPQSIKLSTHTLIHPSNLPVLSAAVSPGKLILYVQAEGNSPVCGILSATHTFHCRHTCHREYIGSGWYG